MMQYYEFCRRIAEMLPVGTELPNPGGGSSTVVSFPQGKIAYRRGNSKFYVAFEDLYEAYDTFRGETLDSTTLRDLNPDVFDSKRGGHSCNCTFLFMALKAIGIVDRIDGAGRRGNPFRVTIPKETD